MSLITSFFSVPSHIQPLLQLRQKLSVSPTTTPSLRPSPKQFPSISSMQRINISLTPAPIVTVSSQPAPSGITLTPSPTSTNTSLAEDSHLSFFMHTINDYRSSQGLSLVTTNNVVCQFALVRAKEISTNFSHDGFNQRVQNHTLPYTSYSLVTENIAETPTYQDVISLWENSPLHAENLRADTPYVCVESYGNYYVYEGLRP